MEFGIALPAAADSSRIVKRAEELGFTHAWFYDSQLLCADCFVAMATAAVNTSRIRLGTGVLIPSNRIAPVAANAFASLNQLAPGRIDFGVGTGFTGRRSMGLNGIKLADMEEYIRVVTAMLRRETIELAIEGKLRKVAFLDPTLKLVNLDDPIGLYIAAYGPRAMAMTAKFKAGWISFMVDADSTLSAIGAMRDTWIKTGHTASDLSAAVFALGCVLAPGEPADSPRALDQAGPLPAILLHWAAEDALAGKQNPYASLPEVARYIEIARNFQPSDAPWLANHRGHLIKLKDVERPLITAEAIKRTTLTGTNDELADRIGALRDAGYTQLTVQLIPGQEHAIEDWARVFRRF
jgi:5,10-methylenetetrahydromethanopterin reductase